MLLNPTMGFFDSLFGTPPKKRKRRKNGVAVGKNWRYLENKGRKTRHFRGYKIHKQKYSSSTKTRPDFVGYSIKNRRERIVGDAKNVKELTMAHIKKMKKYKGHPNYAQKGVYIVAKRTKVSPEVRNEAKRSNITITKMGARGRKKKRDFWDW